jgi:subtilisin-like proprotein convertase family protein
MPSPRRRQIALLALAVLCGLLTWRASERIAQSPKPTPIAEAGAPVSPVPTAAPKPTAPRIPGRLKWVAAEVLMPGQAPKILDPKFTNRFRNTAASLDELIRNDRALNLRNALVDTASGQPLELPAGLEAGAEPGAFLVQSHGMLSEQLRRDLKAAGLQVVTYMPNNAYLVTGSREAMERAADSAEVAAVLPFAPAFKLEPELLAQVLSPDRTAANQTVLLTVPDPDKTMPDVLALGGQEVFRERGPFGTLLTVATAGDRLADLARLPGVLMVERWMPRELANDLAGPAMGSTTNLDNTGSYLELTGEGVLMNINDSGVDASHPDLVNRVSTISNLAATVLVDRDGHGTHVAGIMAGDGTASGTIAGTPQGSTNTANFQGRAPKAKLFVLPVDLIQGPPSGDTFLQEEAARAPGRANRNRPLISNNSWGYSTREYTSKSASYDAAVRDALPRESGSQPILYVFSAGNDGLGGNAGVGGIPDSIASPGNAKNVITVGALESPRNLTNAIVYDTNGVAVKIGSQEIPGRGYNPTNTTYFTNEVLKPFTDTAFQVAAYSSRGNVGVEIEGSSGRFKPDVVAPGSFVLSARSAAWRIERQYPRDPFTGEFPDEYYLYGELERTNATAYRFESGTSMAAPAISGLLAQMQQFFEQRLNLTPSAASYKALLINSSLAPSETYEPDTRESFNYAGWGQPTLPRALRSGLRVPGSDRELAYIEGGAGLATRQAGSFKIKLTATNAPLRFTLVWTDPPGNPAASTKLVNDLDLVVSNTVTGEVFLGNDFASGSGFSRVMTTNGPSLADRVNNVERVVLPSPLADEYEVFVVAHRVNVNARWDNPNQISQDFSLAISTDAAEGEFVGELTNPTLVDPVVLGLPAPTAPLVITNGVAMFNLKAGAHSPLIGDQRGTTNQWRFFVFTNIPGTTTNGEIVRTNGSNVAFVIFPSLPDANLSRTRTNGPDLDLFVSRDPGLLTLSPSAVSGSLKSRSREATELIAITNAPLGDDSIYYVGVKSEDQQGGEFAFFGISTDQPFITFDDNGFPHPFTTQLRSLTDGSPSTPGVGQWIAISLVSDELRRVNPMVTVSHDSFQDLYGQLQLRSTFAVLNNHATLRDLVGGSNVTVLYDDSGSGDYSDFSGVRPSDGPGSLNEFMGVSGGGPWFFTMIDNAVGNEGSINALDLQLRPNDFGPQFVERCVRARQVELEVINIPADASRLTITITNRQNEQLTGPLEVYVRREAFPDISNPTNNDKFATIFPPNGGDVVLSLRDVPPLTPGRYFIAVYNPNSFEICYRIRGRVERGQDGNLTKIFESGTINQTIADHGVSYSGVVVDDPRPVTAIGAGLRFEHPRLSDLSIRLINPLGDSTVLVENRGRTNATAFGRELITTNGNFAHVAMTFERTSGRAQVYVNGLRVAEQNFVGFIPDTTNSLRFGTDGVRGNGGPMVLDDFGLWRRVLTADNIRDIYRYGIEDLRGKDVTDAEAGLVAFWPFNGNGDELVGGANAVLAGASSVAGQVGQALQLGVGVVPAPERSQPLDVVRNVGFTLEGWVNANTNTPVIVAGWAGTNGNVGPLLLANYPPPLGNGPGSFSVAFTNLTVAETNSTGVALGTTGGLVTPGATVTNTIYAVFTELTNLNSEAIKFAVPPFVSDTRRRVLAASTFDVPRTGDQFFTVGEFVDGWTVVSNTVQWDYFPDDALTGTSCIELFPNLGRGTGSRIRRSFPTTPGRYYTLSVGYRRVPSSSGPSSTVEVYADGLLVSSFTGEEAWRTNASVVQATTNAITFDIANPAGVEEPSRGARAVARVDAVGRVVGVDVLDGGSGYESAPTVGFRVVGFPNRGTGARAVATVQDGAVIRVEVTRPGTNYASAPLVTIAAPPVDPSPAPTFLDEIRFVEEPTGLYVPEEPLRPLAKGSALGQWRLEVTDSRAGEIGNILEWQMQLTFAPTNPPAYRLKSGVPFTTNVIGDALTYFIVEVPPEVYATTNTLVSVTGGPLNLLYSQTGLPDGFQADDYTLLAGVVDAPQSSLLLTNVLPELQPGQRYYLGVQNAIPGQTTTFTIQVDFGLPLTPLTNNVPFRGTNPNRGLIDYYSFNVTPEALGVRFSVSNLSGDVNLVVQRSPNFPTRTVFDYASTNTGVVPESVQIDPFSVPVTLTPGLWYLGVYPADPNPTNQLNYTIMAQAVVGNTTPITNGVPIATSITNAGLIEYYYLDITNAVESVTFALTNIAGNVDLYVRKGLPLPGPSSFEYASTNSGNVDEVIVLQANRNMDLQSPGRWFLAAIPRGPVPVSYSVVAKFQEADSNIRILVDSVPDLVSVATGPTNLLYRFDVPPDSTTRIIFEIYGLTGDADLLVSKDLPPDQSPAVLSSIKPRLQNELVVASTDRFPQLGGEWYVQVRFPGVLTNSVECTVRAATRQDGLLVSGAPLVMTYSDPTAAGQTPIIQWNAVPGELYQVQSTPDLSSNPLVWAPVISPAVMPGEQGLALIPFANPTFPTFYYRVIQLPNP